MGWLNNLYVHPPVLSFLKPTLCYHVHKGGATLELISKKIRRYITTHPISASAFGCNSFGYLPRLLPHRRLALATNLLPFAVAVVAALAGEGVEGEGAILSKLFHR